MKHHEKMQKEEIEELNRENFLRSYARTYVAAGEIMERDRAHQVAIAHAITDTLVRNLRWVGQQFRDKNQGGTV